MNLNVFDKESLISVINFDAPPITPTTDFDLYKITWKFLTYQLKPDKT